MKPIVRRGLAVALLSVGIGIGVSSCGADDSCACTYPGDDPENDAASADGPVIAADRSDDEEFDPAGSTIGRLTLQDGCLVISDAIPLWPYGTSWDEATSSVRVPTWSTPVRTGRRVILGGGFIKLPDEPLEWLSTEAHKDALECLERRERPRLVFFVARDDPAG